MNIQNNFISVNSENREGNKHVAYTFIKDRKIYIVYNEKQ